MILMQACVSCMGHSSPDTICCAPRQDFHCDEGQHVSPKVEPGARGATDIKWRTLHWHNMMPVSASYPPPNPLPTHTWMTASEHACVRMQSICRHTTHIHGGNQQRTCQCCHACEKGHCRQQSLQCAAAEDAPEVTQVPAANNTGRHSTAHTHIALLLLLLLLASMPAGDSCIL